ncbi:MAG TPA: GNAT family N-acetyltransferase [Flavobacteriaceae bacterium]|nr:GNAT family N-acetyltransferase [Flavobacteriaceae bacterium]
MFLEKGFSLYNPNQKPTSAQREELVEFLFQQLEEYGDPKEDIIACLKFALKESEQGLGGFALTYKNEALEIVGATIINKTGMGNYIPDNILVYIAVHKSTRGQGVGRKVMEKALEIAEGSVALHVEPDNPAKYLYEKLGFTNKYLEMRYEP